MILPQIINSLLENDMYKFSMGQCIYHQFSAYKTTWTFKFRNTDVFFTSEMVEEIKSKNALGENTVFICPVGPVGQYPYFVDMVNEQNISLKNVWFINMD